METITILGAGYVGLTTASILANCGYVVYLVEPNISRLETIRSGRSFFYEDGIDPLISRAIKDKTLIPTSSYSKSLSESKFIFSCVGTPDNPDGSSNLSYVFSAAESAAKLMRPGAIYIQKSTVPVGTGREVIDIISRYQADFSYVSNPEFLREGTSVSDALYFDRVVVGGDNHDANQAVLSLYSNIETARDALADTAGILRRDTTGEYIETNLNGAELVKVTANAFLALKISFANNIAKLADRAGADIKSIMDAVGADKRIGRAFLNAGRGYGGGCFPKDVSGLITSAEDYGVDMPIMAAATEVNESMAGYIANKAKDLLGGVLEEKKIAVLGLAFKAGTSDARKSPGVKLANVLDKNGSRVRVYDPEASEEAREDLRNNIKITESVEEAVKGADAVIISTDWPELINLDINKIATLMEGSLFVDAVNAYTIKDVEDAKLIYTGVGRNGSQ